MTVVDETGVEHKMQQDNASKFILQNTSIQKVGMRLVGINLIAPFKRIDARGVFRSTILLIEFMEGSLQSWFF